jgi:excisionase family DNA binding protein
MLILVYTNMAISPVHNPPIEPREVIRVSISEAARLFGVNPQTIRRAIRDQEITYVVVGGRYKINFESLVKWSQRKVTVKHKSEKHGIGQFVDRWKISNTLYSPSTKAVRKKIADTPAPPDTIANPIDKQVPNPDTIDIS